MLFRASLFALIAWAASATTLPGFAQSTDVTPAVATVPNLIRYSGTAPRSDSQAGPVEVSITFLMYKDQQGGDPLWTETQTAAVDSAGHYDVHLGATTSSGLPADLFASGEARWLEVQVAGSKPERRTLLVSVPYAMKAADAATLGGLPASAFLLAGTKSSETPSAAISPEASANAVTTPGGTAGYLPVYSGATTVDDSILFESGTKIGIGSNTPAATLDVNGTVAARGALTLESNGTATTAGGRNSQPLNFMASAYNAATKAAVAPLFSLQTEPFGNNTTTPGGTLNLLYGNGATPAETGLSISSKGIVKFASGQTFPGAGAITGVTTASPLTGSGTTGSVALGLNLTALETTLNTKYAQLGTANKFTQPITFAASQTFPGTGKGTITGVTTSSPLTGSGTTGSVALGLNLTALETTLNVKYAQLGAANKFTSPVTFSAPVTFAPNQIFPGTGKGTITGVTTSSPLTGSGTTGSVALGLNLTALETMLNAKYAQLGAVNKFTQPITFASNQTFPGIPGGGTITGVTTASPLLGSGTKGTVALSLNLPVLETTLNAKYAQLGAANKFTQPITFAAGQTFPGAGTITAVTAGTGLTGGGTAGAIKLALDPKAVPTLTGSPVFNGSSGNGMVGDTAGNTVGTAGVLGMAGSGNTSGFGGIAGVWGNASAHVGVLGTSDQYAGVQGISKTGYGVQGTSTSNTAVSGTSGSGAGVAGSSTTGAGMVGYTAGSTLGTAGTFGIAGSRTSFNGIAGIWGDAATHVGVFGSSNQYAGVSGASVSGAGVQGSSTSGSGGSFTSSGAVATLASVNSGTTTASAIYAATSGPDASTIFAYSTGSGGYAISGVASGGADSVGAPPVGIYGYSASGNGIHGVSASTSGIFGETSSTSAQDAAFYGYSHGNASGVYAFSAKTGIHAVSGGMSVTGAQSYAFSNGPAGVWGDTSGGGYGVAGTADDGMAGEFINSSASQQTMYVGNQYAGNSSVAEFAGNRGSCEFFGNGDVLCTGTVSASAVTKDGARAVKTYSVQSTENWYEDAGSAQLVNGVAHVELDPTFGQTVNSDVEYHVFLTPGGDSDGLYVTNKTAQGFEVHEQHGGHSNIAFDYRIMAKRAGHENERLEDVTERMKKQAEIRARMTRADKAASATANAAR